MTRTVAVRLSHRDENGFECDGPIPVRLDYEPPGAYGNGGYAADDVPQSCLECGEPLTEDQQERIAELAEEIAAEIDQDERYAGRGR